MNEGWVFDSSTREYKLIDKYGNLVFSVTEEVCRRLNMDPAVIYAHQRGWIK